MSPEDMIQSFTLNLIAGLITGIVTSIFASLIAVSVIEYNKFLSALINEIEYNRDMFNKFPENLNYIKKEWLDKKWVWLPKRASPGASRYLYQYLPSVNFNNFSSRGYSQNIEPGRFERLVLFYNVCKEFSDKSQMVEENINFLNRNDPNYGINVEQLCTQMNNLYRGLEHNFFEQYNNFNPKDKKGLRYHILRDLKNIFI